MYILNYALLQYILIAFNAFRKFITRESSTIY